MSGISPITVNEALEKISSFYHPIFNVIIDEYVMPSESIIFVADTTRHRIVDQEDVSILKALAGTYSTTHKDVVENFATLVVVTDRRWLRISLSLYEYEYSIRLDGVTGVVDKLLFGDKLNFEWHTPPKEFPHDLLHKQRKSVREYVTERIGVAPLSDISVSKREEFILFNEHTIPESQIHLVRLLFKSGLFYSLRFDEGVFLHKLLQIASLNNGAIPLEDTLQKLKKLKDMFDNGLITEKEYQSKKEQLLEKM